MASQQVRISVSSFGRLQMTTRNEQTRGNPQGLESLR